MDTNRMKLEHFTQVGLNADWCVSTYRITSNGESARMGLLIQDDEYETGDDEPHYSLIYATSNDDDTLFAVLCDGTESFIFNSIMLNGIDYYCKLGLVKIAELKGTTK